MVAVSSPSISSTSNSKSLVRSLMRRFASVILLVVVWTCWKQRRDDGDGSVDISTRKATIAHSSEVTEETIEGVPVLWRKPSRVRGILFVAHGCSHSHTDWFVKSESCPICIGLPSELSIVDIALKHNLLVVAVSSQDRIRKCWNARSDGDRVAGVLREFGSRYNGVPLWAFGASSGGAFVSRLAENMRSEGVELSGFISQISANTPSPTNGLDCAVYITMNRDLGTDERAKEHLQTWLKERSGPAVKHVRLAPLLITESLFSDRASHNGPSPDKSKQMVGALKDTGFLDGEGLLREDPRRSNWRSILHPLSVHAENEGPWFVKDEFAPDRSAISEIMNVAYSQHEMTPDGVEEGLKFCLEERNKRREAKTEQK